MKVIKACKMKVTTEESKIIQEICFENGIYWKSGDEEVLHTNTHYLSVSDVIGFWEESYKIDYINDEREEVTAKEFIEKYGKQNREDREEPTKDGLLEEISKAISDIDKCNYGLAKQRLENIEKVYKGGLAWKIKKFIFSTKS